MATAITQAHAVAFLVEPHPADAMWVDPAYITFSLENVTIHDTFTVVVWLNITSDDVFGWQVALKYDRDQLKCTSASFTAAPTSDFMKGHTTTVGGPTIDTSYLGNGSVLAFESCLGTDYIPAPRNGSLISMQFEVLKVPGTGETLTSIFDISTNYPTYTWVKNYDLVKISITTFDGNYNVIPEFANISILPIFMALTLIAVALIKKKAWKTSKPL